MHYGRLRRNGNLDGRKPRKDKYQHSHGYLVKAVDDHPLETPGSHGYVYEHRVVFYQTFGAGPFECHHCGGRVTWDDMHVDHLNDEKDDNRPENLVASCARCNQKRGFHKVMAAARTRYGIEHSGVKLLPTEWAARIGLSVSTLRNRLRAGWPIERALTEAANPTGVKRTRANRMAERT